ncbi:DedA family protein [Sporomusa sp.]|uniref:DedA family protein n=1 Tax=Sporomusa sp. TaxID=2078658 RepID=UPI002C44743A|nr:DedA family protein [Sporomusa sp.]HWR44431.1 DedA family protein [Sporomusa sp.]
MTIDFSPLIEIIEQYSYGAVCLAMVLEGMCLPVPSELVLGFAGFMVYQGVFSFPAAVGAGWLGSMLGSLFIYFVARQGGRNFLYKFCRIFRLSPVYIDKMGEAFICYGPQIIIPWRQLPIVRTKISIAAGLLNMRLATFCLLTALGIAVWCTLAVSLGLFFGPHWQKLIDIFTELGYLVIALGGIIAVVIGIYWYSRRKRKKEATDNCS